MFQASVATLYIPVQSGGHEGQVEQLRPTVQLLQEAVHQLGSLAEEALLERGDAFAMQGPKQLPPAEEWLIAEEAAQSCVLGHHVGAGRWSALLGRIKARGLGH